MLRSPEDESKAPHGFGDGEFAIRCPDSTTIEEPNQLGQGITPEVPTVGPSPSGAISCPFPPDLARVAAVWDDLPQAIKAGVLALVQAAAGPGGRP